MLQEKKLEELKNVLKNASFSEKLYAVWFLSMHLDKEEVVDTFIENLSNTDWGIRKNIAEKLIEHSSPYIKEKIKEILKEALNNSQIDEDKLFWCMHIAAHIKELIKFIIPFSRHPNTSFRKYCAINLGKATHSSEALSTLINMLSDSVWSVRNVAASSIEKFGKKAIPVLNKAFKTGNEDVKYWSIKLMGKIGGEEVLGVFASILKSNNPKLRFYAYTAISEINSEKILPLLLKGLSDKIWKIRVEVAGAIVKHYDKSILPTLEKYYEKSDINTKFWIIQIIAELAKEEALPIIEKFIEKASVEVKSYCIQAMASINSEKVVPKLVEFFNSESWLLRKRASEAIISINPENLSPIIEKLKSEEENDRYWAIKTLSKLRGGREILDKFIEEADKKSKVFFIQILSEIPTIEHAEKVAEFLTDEEWLVRKEAAQSLKTSFKEFAFAIVFPMLSSSNPDVRFWSCRIIESVPVDEVELLNQVEQGDKNSMIALATRLNNEFFNKLIEWIKNRSHLFSTFLDTVHPQIGPKFVKEVIKLANETSEWNIMYSLALILEKVISNWVITAIESYSTITNRDLKAFLVKLLAEVKQIDSIEFLLKAASDEDQTVAFEAIKALVKNFRSEYVFNALCKIVKKSNPEIKTAFLDLIHGLQDRDLAIVALDFALKAKREEEQKWFIKLFAENMRGANSKSILSFSKINPQYDKLIKLAIKYLQAKVQL